MANVIPAKADRKMRLCRIILSGYSPQISTNGWTHGYQHSDLIWVRFGPELSALLDEKVVRVEDEDALNISYPWTI